MFLGSMEADMDECYLIARQQASLAMARTASASARLIHLELAGRYGMAAARHGQGRAPAGCPDIRPGATSFHA